MKKTLLAALMFVSTYVSANQIGMISETQCIQKSFELVIGVEDVVFDIAECSEEQIITDLKLVLPEVIGKPVSYESDLMIEQANLDEVLASLKVQLDDKDMLKVLGFLGEPDSHEFKQRGNFQTHINGVSNKFNLVILYTAEKDKLIMFYKSSETPQE
ncbi:hypothetical protein [Bacteriovorax sp. DB6_IX]|uniref:hypothetical protein n=1 Tax=Bacteriovorax sp. DB6_IX TaxID=1353530 RepID=UPI00038A277B|nr:hypothetical protein [Bacteriovorax sp. DB6_IX]EQC52787.1 hypothetical protein M901_0945 [Bacteriovorax sp. DB6_IX]